MNKIISNKIDNINRTILRSMSEGNIEHIIKNFTNECIKIFGADFGFAWGKFNDSQNYSLSYKTTGAPESPSIPTEKDSKHIVVPIHYGDHMYGSIVLGYKKDHRLTDEEISLIYTIGNSIAQTITINWLVKKEERSLILAEKQKETEVLLSQEKLKTEFIQNATHELRTPLAIMKGNVDLALIHGLRDEKTTKALLNTVNTEIKHLSNIIEDLSIFTTEGKTTEQIIRSSSVDLSILLQNTVERLQTLTKDKKISLNLTGEFGQSFMVFGDEKYLEKLFINIIKNAINYGKENGTISVEILKVKNNAQIKITDDGIGIKPEELPKVFERFYRTEDARELKKKGIGLGLAISQWVTKIHGGTIDVKSTYGKGTTFTVELPLANE